MVTTRFEHFGKTALGQRLSALIDTPERYIEYRAFSREGFPAVTALVSAMKAELAGLDTRERDAAKQFVGWRVGEIMRRHGHEVGKKAARVPGGFFTVGAVWAGSVVVGAALSSQPVGSAIQEHRPL